MINFKGTYPTPIEHSPWVNTCEYILVHHTATGSGTIKWVLDGLFRRLDYASVQYTIDENGDIYKIGNDTDILWHAGKSSWDGKSDLNKYSIGIEVLGPLADGGFTDAQRESLKILILDLMKTHKIGIDWVIRHKDIAPKRKPDIADTLWNKSFSSWEEYKKSFLNPPLTMWKFKQILDKEFPSFSKLFDDYNDSETITAGDAKALIAIGIAKAKKQKLI